DGQQAVLVPQGVLAALFRWGDILALADDRAHPGERRDDVLLCQTEAGEVRLHSPQQVVDLLRGDARLAVEVVAVVEVGRAEQRDTLPGEDEHGPPVVGVRSEEHTSELQSRENLVCRLLLEKKKNKHNRYKDIYISRGVGWQSQGHS